MSIRSEVKEMRFRLEGIQRDIMWILEGAVQEMRCRLEVKSKRCDVDIVD